jgi:uncharacterized membrane protein YjgN (DUF898 family)
MKNYFDFTLTGKKFLPIWLVFYILIIIPNGLYYKSLTGQSQTNNPSPLLGLALIGIMIAACLISFFIIKLSIENIKYRENQIRFDGKFFSYVGKILLGFLLSIITLTIYMAWFIRDINSFIVDNSSVDSTHFQFKGKGGKLFIILLLTMTLPIILLTLLLGKYFLAHNQSFLFSLVHQGILMIILIPYFYFFYKWMIDIKFKDYHITWQTSFGNSFVKILIEILLTMITCGIYMPLAYLKIYKYFSERTIAEKENSSLRFGYDLDSVNDFLFIWGQMLLSIITIGIYYPWAFSKIGKRVLSKTYVIKTNAA